MALFRVVKPIGFGGRKEKGEIVEMSPESAAGWGEDYLVPADQPEPVETEEKVSYTEDELEAMKKDELMNIAKKLKTPTSGTKADIIERILLALQE